MHAHAMKVMLDNNKLQVSIFRLIYIWFYVTISLHVHDKTITCIQVIVVSLYMQCVRPSCAYTVKLFIVILTLKYLVNTEISLIIHDNYWCRCFRFSIITLMNLSINTYDKQIILNVIMVRNKVYLLYCTFYQVVIFKVLDNTVSLLTWGNLNNW